MIGQRTVERSYTVDDREKTNYYRDHIIVISIDNENQIEWERLIPKKQVFQNHTFFLNYSYLLMNDNLYFVFNDNIDNHSVNLKKISEMSRSKNKGVVTIAKINEEGMLSTQILTDIKTTGCMLTPEKTTKNTDNSMMLFLRNDNNKIWKALLVKID